MRRLFARFALAVSAFAIIAGPAAAQTRVTLKSATASSSYYVMMVQLGEVLRAETKGQIQDTVEESQGRAEERRVGKEWVGTWRSRGSPDHEKKNMAGRRSEVQVWLGNGTLAKAGSEGRRV